MIGSLIIISLGAYGAYRLGCWVHDRGEARDSGRERLGPLLGSAHAPAPAGSQTTKHEVGRHDHA